MASKSAAAKTQDAVAMLKADHRKVEELFEQFESARGGARKESLVKKICAELSVHATIEEEIFYPACKGEIEDEDLLQESYVEHDGAKMLIAELAEASASDDFYDAKVTVLKEMIEHHVEEEEKRSEGLFAQAKAAGLDMDELAARMQARKHELTAEIEQNGLPAPITRTFAGAPVEHGQPVDARG